MSLLLFDAVCIRIGNARACVFGSHDIGAGCMAAVSPVHPAFIGVQMRAETQEDGARVSVVTKKIFCGSRGTMFAKPS
jgi:hypothetical protein